MKLNDDQTRMYILDHALIALIGVVLALSAWRLSEGETESFRTIFGLPLPHIPVPGFVDLGIVMFFLSVFAVLLVVGVFRGLHEQGFKLVTYLSPVLGLVIWVSFAIALVEGIGDLAVDVAGGGNRPRWLVYALVYFGFLGFLVYGVFWSTTQRRVWLRRHHADSVASDRQARGGLPGGTALLVVGIALILGFMLRRWRS